MDDVFPIAGAGLILVTIAWAVIHVRAGGTRWFGIIGSALCAVVVGAIGFLSDVSWLWVLPTVWFAAWVLGLVFLGIELSKASYGTPPGGKLAIACNFIAMSLSGIAFLIMLWVATVSPGGV